MLAEESLYTPLEGYEIPKIPKLNPPFSVQDYLHYSLVADKNYYPRKLIVIPADLLDEELKRPFSVEDYIQYSLAEDKRYYSRKF